MAKVCNIGKRTIMSNIHGTFIGILEKNNNVLYSSHIIVPPKIVKELKSKKIKRFICNLDQKSEIHAGLIPNGKGAYFIKINKELRVKHQLNFGDAIPIVLSEDTSEYGIELPEEMSELFIQDPVGDRHFHALTPGKQRSLLYLVNKLKSPEKRLQKAVIIMEHLNEQKGQLDFKILHQDFKDKK